MRELIEGPLLPNMRKLILFLIFIKMHWNFGKISFVLPRVVIDRIQAIPIQSFGEREDTLMWKFSADGEFNTASAYRLTISNQPKFPSFSGCWVWGVDTLPKLRHFLWLCNHASIPTRQVIKYRGIDCSILCPLCNAQEGSIIHTLRDCPFVRKFWLSIGVPQVPIDFLSLDLLVWLKNSCLCSRNIQANDLPWCFIFPFAVWWLWKHRNKVVFENCPTNLKLYLSCIQVVRQYFYCVSKTQKTEHNIAVQVRWFKPPR